MSPDTAPPRWARWLVAHIIPSRDREFLCADLDEAYARRRARGQRALSWYLAQAAHAAIGRRLPPATLAEHRRFEGGTMIRSVLTDARLAWRSCVRQPGVTSAIVLSLALGLGAASAMYTVVHAVLLAPLPYRQTDRLVTMWSKWDGYDRTWLSSTDMREVRTKSQLAEDVAMWTWDRVALTGSGDAASLITGVVTANTFDVLGASPLYGRVFTDSEALAATKSGQTMFAVLGYDLWRHTFLGDPSVVGRTITIDDRPVTVLGVMPAHFQLPTDFGSAAPTELWTPIYHDPSMNEGGYSYFGAARLRGGASLPAFNAELEGFAAQFVRAGRKKPSHFAVYAVGVNDDVLGRVRPSLGVLVAAVVVLLVIACINAAALLLARAETRRREWATRVALGAGTWRLLRAQLTESALLALAGGMLGIGLAVMAARMLHAIGPVAIPRAADVAVDWRILWFMLALSVFATLLSSLAPAIQAFRLNTVEGLNDGNRSASAGRARLRVRSLLVVAQLAFGMLLLTGAGLLGRSLFEMRQIDLGLDPAHVLTARVSLPATRYAKAEDVNAYVDAVSARLRQMPGIKAAGLVRVLPLAQTIGNWPVTVEGFTPQPDEKPAGDWQTATPGALEALGERLVAGRFFADGDTAAAPVVALVNETMARLYWPGGDPVGRRIRFSNDAPLVWATVVGVIGDVHHNGVTTAVKPKFYLPYAQFVKATGDKPITTGAIVLRTDGDPLAQVAALRLAATAVDRTVPLSAVRPMRDVVDAAMTTPRLISQVMTSFAVVGLLLSALGLFGLLVYLVAQRTHEIGIRMAIGASASDVARQVVTEGLRVVGLGLAIGLLLAAVAARGLSSLLYEVPPWDPITWTIAPGVLVVVAVIASVVPALRASRINPLSALRKA